MKFDSQQLRYQIHHKVIGWVRLTSEGEKVWRQSGRERDGPFAVRREGREGGREGGEGGREEEKKERRGWEAESAYGS